MARRGIGSVGFGGRIRRRRPGGVVAASRRVLVLGVCCAGVLGVVGVTPAAAETKTKKCDPRVGARDEEARFVVWYCQGDKGGPAASKLVALRLDEVWTRETAPEPNGLGPPIKPEANGGSISVYVTAPDEEVEFGKCPECLMEAVEGNYGIARPVAPFSKNRDGGLTSSGALVINEKKGLNDATLIHEFFHVLQFKYNWPVVDTWLGEAIATWAEVKYGAEETLSRVSYFKDFQRDPGAGLNTKSNNPVLAREYGAYVWLIWLAQHTKSDDAVKGDHAVFRLWSALQPAPAKVSTSPPKSVNDVIDPKVIDPLVDKYLAARGLSWAGHFKDFAVEDLNRLLPPVTPHLFSHKPFGDMALSPDVLQPDLVRPASKLTVGAHQTVVGTEAEGVGTLNPLGAQYEHIKAISDHVKAVKVTSSGMKPWGDLVVLAHTNNEWQRRDVRDGSVIFCRRTIETEDQLYLIADNHDDLNPHSRASYTVTGESSCP